MDDLATTLLTSPSGAFELDAEGAVTALVRDNLRTAERVRAAVDTLASLDGPPFLPLSEAQRGEDGLMLRWRADGLPREPLHDLMRAWRLEARLHVAEAIWVALVVARAVSELSHLAPTRFLLSPVQVFRRTTEGGRQAWLAAPLPHVGAPLRDFAEASAPLTSWLGGDELVGRGGADLTLILGLILYEALVGEAYPADMPRTERLLRQLAYRAGVVARRTAALTVAGPPSLAAPLRTLGDFIGDALQPPAARALTPARAVATLRRLQNELSAPILAGAWEAAGRPDTALQVLQSFVRYGPREEAPWATIARLGGEAPTPDPGRSPAPHAATGAGGGSDEVSRIRALAAAGPSGLAALREALAAPLQPPADAAAEEPFLFGAYARARWLGEGAALLPLLAQQLFVTWSRVQQALLQARIAVESRSWLQVARACRDALRSVERLPSGGETRGDYALAYALMLDAAAHVAFVEAGQDSGYLSDAWTRLERALALSAGLDAPPLAAAIRARLGQLAQAAARYPAMASLRARLDRACGEVGVAAYGIDPAPAPIPWPDDRWLFSG